MRNSVTDFNEEKESHFKLFNIQFYEPSARLRSHDTWSYNLSPCAKIGRIAQHRIVFQMFANANAFRTFVIDSRDVKFPAILVT